MFKLRPFVHWLLWTASPVCGQREIGRFGVQDLGREFSIVRWLVNEAERRHIMTSCLSSAPSSTGYCQRRHRSVNNVKPVGFEFKIWVVDMLSVRWECGACAVALMLRADIRQFSIVRRLVNEDMCAVALMLRVDILSTTLTSERSLQSKTPYYQGGASLVIVMDSWRARNVTRGANEM